jgi:excisionase family DNA binding protein
MKHHGTSKKRTNSLPLGPLGLPSPLGQPVYTTEQVAAALNLSVRTLLRAIKTGALEARRTGKHYLIMRDAVQRYWNSLPLATVAPKTVGRRPKR